MKKGRGKVMTNGGEVIGAYRQLEARTSRMAALALQQDWDSLAGQEEDYVMAIAELAELEARVELDEPQRQEKRRMLERILAHNQETRRCLMRRRDELAGLMAAARCERDLDRSYGAHAGMHGHVLRSARKRDS